ncbi:hypothetical protein KFL_007280030 [Klebsormidium nitens]|uniref:Uncharacterized protein n=1 Tax=Klebsormidium nitens TaxID=105231 RepID=A0A1Y1IJZ0_KLENI|nr:hypothetical protein KFL_007280030 [Klebsormidium nitens]|eukprot:GAQ91104.1 hypothetical protein KFL_007280030 [Klebsormidium nitens]
MGRLMALIQKQARNKKGSGIQSGKSDKRAVLEFQYRRAVKNKEKWAKEKLQSRLSAREKQKKNKEVQDAINAGQKRRQKLNEEEAATVRRQVALGERAAMGRELSKQGKGKKKNNPNQNTGTQDVSHIEMVQGLNRQGKQNSPGQSAKALEPTETARNNPLFESNVHNGQQSATLLAPQQMLGGSVVTSHDNPLFKPGTPDVRSSLRLLKSSQGKRSLRPVATLPDYLEPQPPAARKRRDEARTIDNDIYNSLQEMDLAKIAENEEREVVERLEQLRFARPAIPKLRRRPFFYEVGAAVSSPDENGWDDHAEAKLIETELPMPRKGHPLTDRIYLRERHPRASENLPAPYKSTALPYRPRATKLPVFDTRNLPVPSSIVVPPLRKRRSTWYEDLPPTSNLNVPTLRTRRAGHPVDILPPTTIDVATTPQRTRHELLVKELPPPNYNMTTPLRERRQGLVNNELFPTHNNRSPGPPDDLPSLSGPFVTPLRIRRAEDMLTVASTSSGLLPPIQAREFKNLRGKRGPVNNLAFKKQNNAGPQPDIGPTGAFPQGRITGKLERSLAFKKRNNQRPLLKHGSTMAKKPSSWSPFGSRTKGYTRIETDSGGDGSSKQASGWFKGWSKRGGYPSTPKLDPNKQAPNGRFDKSQHKSSRDSGGDGSSKQASGWFKGWSKRGGYPSTPTLDSNKQAPNGRFDKSQHESSRDSGGDRSSK